MKWVKTSLVVLLLGAALFFAYQSFEANFNPRRGQEGKSGQPKMSPAMLKKMEEINQMKRSAAEKKAGAETAGRPHDKKAGETAAGKETNSKETQSKGGE